MTITTKADVDQEVLFFHDGKIKSAEVIWIDIEVYVPEAFRAFYKLQGVHRRIPEDNIFLTQSEAIKAIGSRFLAKKEKENELQQS